MSRQTLLLLCTMLPLVVGATHPSVKISLGHLRGKHMQTRGGRMFQAFLGIPYAKPPLGRLRFQPPQPPEPWFSERLATSHPRPCKQLIRLIGSEDCLYLNVYTPNVTSNPTLAVLVYFYGGSFELGGADSYPPDYLLDEDIVFVCIQYRLGLFGFLSTGDEIVPGNMGLKDLRVGLQWIQENIVQFGGDPTKVTIMGESSGATLVHHFLLFAADQGLFRAAINHSGSALAPWSFKSPVEIKKMVQKLSRLSFCPSDSAGFVDCLRKKSAVTLVLLYSIIYKNTMYPGLSLVTSQLLPFLGIVIEPECAEDRFVYDSPWTRNTSLPLLTGVTSKEALFMFVGQLNDRTGLGFRLLDLVFNRYLPLVANYQNSQADGSNISRLFRDFYIKNQSIGGKALSSFIDGVSDILIVYPTYEAALRSSQENTYFYLYDYIAVNRFFPMPPNVRYGASHVDDLFMFFPHPALPAPFFRYYPSEADDIVSRKMVKLWANFVTYLDPTPEESTEEVKWTPFHPRQSYLHINRDRLVMEDQLFAKRMAFWKGVPYPFRDDKFSAPKCKNVEG